ncbi:hypothetical protein F2P56_001331 [Juglans regia]|uniref:Retrovirus-related Pol polyprotein from transposon TNT 1-94-like beta-barrel domain-containing protein n=1 Tax=Juglans regia TaxID=51240 RepID=A0A834D8I5_JUGRE|nr:hypothetical protein F2P56_001331 [Juglans regia]
MVPYLKGQQLFHFVDGTGIPPFPFLPDKTPDPTFLSWTQTDQLILSTLISTLSDNLIAQMIGYSTAREVWKAIDKLFTSQSHARIIQLRYQLATISKGSSSVSDYFQKVKHLYDTMSAAGSPLTPVEFLSYLLAGLNSEYDAFVTSVTARLEPFSTEELYSLLLTYESHLSHNNHLPSSFNPLANYRGNGRGRERERGRGRGRHNPPSPMPSTNSPSQMSFNLPHSKPTCQLCAKVGHVVLNCYHRFNQAYQSDPPRSLTAHYTTSTLALDTAWYPDTAATNHLTSDLSHLNLSSAPYGGTHKIRVGDGSALPISNIGDSILSTSSHSFLLKKLLHVPNITKNLISVRQFCFDNSVFFEFHSSFFVVNDSKMRTPLLHGPTHDGLYSFPSSKTSSSPQALVGERASSSQ